MTPTVQVSQHSGLPPKQRAGWFLWRAEESGAIRELLALRAGLRVWVHWPQQRRHSPGGSEHSAGRPAAQACPAGLLTAAGSSRGRLPPVPSRPPAPSALRVFPSVSDALLYKDDRRGSLGRTPRTLLPGGRPIKDHVSKRGRVERGQGRGLHRRRDRRDCSGVTNQDTHGHGTRVLMKNAIARQPRVRRACDVGQPRAASRDSGPGGAACQASEATRRHPWLEAVEGGVRNATGGPRMAR